MASLGMGSDAATRLTAFIADLKPGLVAYVPWSFLGYFCVLLIAYLARITNPKAVQVSTGLQFLHNIFLSLQSAGLMVMTWLLFCDTARLSSLEDASNLFTHPKNFLDVLTHRIVERTNSVHFEAAMFFCLASKLYETVDTVILILNAKSLLLLHVWHHATTCAAFYTGLFTGAGLWIGMLNSFIHVVMYMYYAKVPGTKAIAKYITSMQITHLFGGVVLNAITLWTPEEAFAAVKFDTGSGVAQPVPVKLFAAFNLFLCFTYFFLFLCFFSKKYHKNGSIWTMMGCSKPVLAEVKRIQTNIFPEAVENYLVAQGLLVNTGEKPAEKAAEKAEKKQ